VSQSEQGEDEQFVRAYRKERHARPAVTVDLVVLTLREGRLSVLLIERGEPPFQGHWALPGGFVQVGDAYDDQGESVEAAAHRELEEETGLERGSVYLAQFHTYGRPYRDPRTRVITVAWFALVSPDRVGDVKAGTDAARADWFSLHRLPPLAFDHQTIVDGALKRVREQLTLSPIAFELVGDEFTIGDLRGVYDGVMGQPCDPGNFRRRFLRMEEDGVVIKTEKKQKTASKPAQLYRFRR